MRCLQSATLSTVVALISLATLNFTAQAQSLPWSYTLDTSNDSLGVDANGNIQPGGSIYEIFGMAVKDDIATDSIWFAFSANLPLYGANLPNPYLDADSNRNGVIDLPAERYPVPDSNIGWGDLFLDFSGSGNLKAASDANQLFGIKFSMNNDSRVSTLGVYSGASVASVTNENAGYSNLANNNNVLSTRSGRSASMGDLAWNSSYFDPYTTTGSYSNPASWMPNVLGSGTKIGEVTLLDQENLVKAGLDPNSFNAPTGEIFGFRIPKALLPVGEFIATVLTECVNDGISMVSRLAPPPPPSPPQPYICPITDGQRNALMPTRIVDGVKIFEEAPSGSWFDPPADMGFQFITQDGTAFTGISGFPCAVAPERPDIITSPFNVLVKNIVTKEYEIIGQYFPGQSVDFTQIYDSPITEFVITGIDPDAWNPNDHGIVTSPGNAPLAFALLLNQESSNVAMRRITDIRTLPIPESVNLETNNNGSGVEIRMPAIEKLPDITGPELTSPCFQDGSCGSAAVPEPSTVAGLALAVAGALKIRRDRRRK